VAKKREAEEEQEYLPRGPASRKRSRPLMGLDPIKKRPTKIWMDYWDLLDIGITYSPNHLRRLWERDQFPKPFKPSPRKLAWHAHEVEGWLRKQEGQVIRNIRKEERPQRELGPQSSSSRPVTEGTTGVTLKAKRAARRA
jgi:hypothetical protein